MDSTENDDDIEAWDWMLSPRADNQFKQLDNKVQDRITTKLDEVISSEWREPEDFLEPLTKSPFQKLRIGDYRLGCRVKHDQQVIRVESIRKREGAYSGDDD